MHLFNRQFDKFFSVNASRNYDSMKNYFLKIFKVSWHEKMAELSEGKYLLRSDEVTLLDIHVAPVWETLYVLNKGVMREDLKSLDLE